VKQRDESQSHISVFCGLFVGLAVVPPCAGGGSCVRYVGQEASGREDGMLSDEGQGRTVIYRA